MDLLKAEEAARNYEDSDDFTGSHKDAFIAGAEWHESTLLTQIESGEKEDEEAAGKQFPISDIEGNWLDTPKKYMRVGYVAGRQSLRLHMQTEIDKRDELLKEMYELLQKSWGNMDVSGKYNLRGDYARANLRYTSLSTEKKEQ